MNRWCKWTATDPDGETCSRFLLLWEVDEELGGHAERLVHRQRGAIGFVPVAEWAGDDNIETLRRDVARSGHLRLERSHDPIRIRRITKTANFQTERFRACHYGRSAQFHSFF